MISILREFTKSWIFRLLIAAVIASFAIFGMRDLFTPVGDDTVVMAGKRKIDTYEFMQRYDNIKQSNAQRGRVFTNEDFVNQGNDVRMLDELSKQEALAAWFDKLGVKPSDKMILAEIAKIPAFFSGVTGKFDKDAYRQRLGMAKITEDEFQQEKSDDIAAQQYMQAAVAGLRAPRIYATAAATMMAQTRDASFFSVTEQNITMPAPPTADELAAYYKDQAANIAQPEIRQASVIQFAPAVFAKSIPISDADLQAAYKFRLDSLSTPETRSFVQISAPDVSTANRIAAQLRAGGDPATVAKNAKGTLIDNADKPKSAITDAKLADAVFAMKTGDVSGPIQGDLGIAVVRMGDIHIGSTPSFDRVKAQLMGELQQEKAADKVNQIVHQFQDAHDAGEDFAVTAQKLGLQITALPPMSKDGKGFDSMGWPAVDKTGQPLDYGKQIPDQILKGIFDLAPGGSSDVIELGNGMYVALRLDQVRPAGPLPFDDRMKAELARSWLTDKVSAAVSAKADEALARINNGEPFAKVAADLKSPVQNLTGVDRQSAGQKLGALAGRIFGTDEGKSFEAQYAPTRFAIGHIDGVHQPDPAAANIASASMSQQMTGSIAGDIQQLTQAGAEAAMKPKTFRAVADRALDVKTPTADSKASSSKAKP